MLLCAASPLAACRVPPLRGRPFPACSAEEAPESTITNRAGRRSPRPSRVSALPQGTPTVRAPRLCPALVPTPASEPGGLSAHSFARPLPHARRRVLRRRRLCQLAVSNGRLVAASEDEAVAEDGAGGLGLCCCSRRRRRRWCCRFTEFNQEGHSVANIKQSQYKPVLIRILRKVVALFTVLDITISECEV